ncbi:MAG: TIGR03086 family metal-binding protein [Chloroflexota bacterium]
MAADPQAPSTGDPLAALDRALAATGQLVAGVRADQWSAPTPCTEWDARQVANHLVYGGLRLTALVADEPAPAAGGDLLGDDPVAAYRAAAARLQAAFARPGVLQRTYPSPFGPLPGAGLVQLRIAEVLIHGWDLARATGQPPALPEDLAEQSLAIFRARLGDGPRTGGPIGCPQPVADDAPAIDRLAAFHGRRV